ncbi:MAG TPA: hypothetical protein VJ047_11380 [Pseudomonas sp.]|nr:hypothetical protein [Pseudomonas sp.]
MTLAKHFSPALCCLLLLVGNGAWAQNQAAELARDPSVGLSREARDNLATIGRYAENVRSRIGEALDSPALRPDNASARRTDSMVDPFAVSPQLREGRRSGGAFNGLPSASKLDVQRQVRVKALLVTGFGRVAQLELPGIVGGRGGAAGGGQTMTVMDGDLVDLGDLGTYTVHIGATKGITLSNPGTPQGNRITLR